MKEKTHRNLSAEIMMVWCVIGIVICGIFSEWTGAIWAFACLCWVIDSWLKDGYTRKQISLLEDQLKQSQDAFNAATNHVHRLQEENNVLRTKAAGKKTTKKKETNE